SLTAARFDGDRVYLVTARSTDPLWAVDASDPAQPRIAGSIAMPGQLDFIEPRGDRLLALGHTSEAGQPWQLAVSLLDVSQLASPQLLGRVVFGSSLGWVGVSSDDLRKAFIVLDPPPAGPGLLLVPVQGWDAATWRWSGGTQLLDWSLDALALRGFLAHPGAVKRAFPVDAAAARLVALSDEALQTVDAGDRAAPRELARLDLARPVATLALAGGAAVELSGDWYRGDMELAVTPALDPEAALPLARVPVAAPQATLYQDGDVVWLLAVDWASGTAWLEGHDFADPTHPRARGRVDLAASEVGGAGVVAAGAPSASLGSGMVRPWGFAGEAVLVGHALVLHRSGWPCPGACASEPGATGQLRVYDLSDPDHPHLASTVDVGQGWSWGLRAMGRFAWLTHFDWDGSSPRGRYDLDRVDLADPASPQLLAQVNVPGAFFAASEDGGRVFTLESWWTGATTPVTWAHGLTLTGAVARLDGSVALDGDAWRAEAAAGAAWVPATTWGSDGATTHLYALDLSTMSIASDQVVRGDGAWLRRAAGGKLFLQSSWVDAGLLVYDLSDPLHPAFERSFRTDAYPWDVVVGGGYAYLPSGVYGVPMLKLAP
ncbi:MAG TPA: beta-propeller domain-containing protein, partial [Anaeromyxobacteraceae bacterium]